MVERASAPVVNAEKAADARAAEATSAGRGVLFIAFAKVYFMMAGASIELILPRLLGTAVFGSYRSMMQIVSPINNVLVTGTIQGVSKFTSEDDSRSAAVQHAGLRAHLILGLLVAALYFALGGWLAARFADPGITTLLRISAGVVLCYSFYAVFVGTANGLRAFHKQAGIDILFATLRATLVVGAAALGFGARGAAVGFVIAAGSILTIASVTLGQWKNAGEGFSTRRMLIYMGPVLLFGVAMNLTMFIDGIILKPIVTHKFEAAGLPHPADLGNTMVAFYSAVQNLVRLPYQAILAVAFVIFPLVSRTTFEKDTEATKGYIQQTMRYSLIFIVGMAVVLGAKGTALLSVAYPPIYRIGGPAMTILGFGYVAFAILTIGGTILNGAGRTGWALAIALITLGVAAGANYLVIPRFDPGQDVLIACAAATTGAMVLGALLSGLACKKLFDAFVPLATLARVGLAVAVCLGLGYVLPEKGKIVTLAEIGFIGVVFLGVLIGTRELGKADVNRFAKVLRKKKPA